VLEVRLHVCGGVLDLALRLLGFALHDTGFVIGHLADDLVEFAFELVPGSVGLVIDTHGSLLGDQRSWIAHHRTPWTRRGKRVDGRMRYRVRPCGQRMPVVPSSAPIVNVAPSASAPPTTTRSVARP